VTTLNIPNTITAGQPGEAAKVQQNFDAIETFANTDLINRDGSVAMQQPLTVVTPTTATHAASKGYVDGLWKPGMGMIWYGATAPTGWLLCQGQSLSRTEYAALFAEIGTTWGSVDANSFTLPDLREKVGVGYKSGSTFAGTLGVSGGAADAVVVSHGHTMGSHTHTGVDHLHGLGGSTGGQSASHTHPAAEGNFVVATINPSGVLGNGGTQIIQANHHASTGAASNDHVHALPATTGAADRSLTTGGPSTNSTSTDGVSGTNKNLQPFATVNYIIKT
jgi:microcystin-dependent protein